MLTLDSTLMAQIQEKFPRLSQQKIREFLLSLALDTSAISDDELIFLPLAYLVQQTPVVIPSQSSIQPTHQQYSIDYKIDYFGKTVTYEKAVVFNQMGVTGNFDSSYEDDLAYVPDFSRALQILLTQEQLTADDFIKVVQYVLSAWQTRFRVEDFYPNIAQQIENFLDNRQS